MEAVERAIQMVYAAAVGAKQNVEKCTRWAARVRSCEASVLRAASSGSRRSRARCASS